VLNHLTCAVFVNLRNTTPTSRDSALSLTSPTLTMHARSNATVKRGCQQLCDGGLVDGDRERGIQMHSVGIALVGDFSSWQRTNKSCLSLRLIRRQQRFAFKSIILSASYVWSTPTGCENLQQEWHLRKASAYWVQAWRRTPLSNIASSAHLTAEIEALENGPTVNCRYICKDSHSL